MYGVPLKVAPPEMPAAEKTQVQSLRNKQKKLSNELKRIGMTHMQLVNRYARTELKAIDLK